MKHGGCSLAPLGTFEGKVPEAAMALVAEREAAIKDGSFTVEIDDSEPEVGLRAAAWTRRSSSGSTGSPSGSATLLANDGIGFALRRGEVIALLGENGAGKTTLMNILFGHYVADAGSVEVVGRPLPPGNPRAALEAGVGMVHQHFTLADNLTVLENIVLGTRPLWQPAAAGGRRRGRGSRDLARRFGLEVDPDARVGDLAVGQCQRVEILKALYRDARVLILDEPTAVLTPQETEALFRTLKLAVAEGLSIVFISHKLGEVMAVSDRVLVLRHGRLVGERPTREHRPARAGAADGRRRGRAAGDAGGAGRAGAARRSPGSRRRTTAACRACAASTWRSRGGRITGLAGVSGNGQAALAGARRRARSRRPRAGWTLLGDAGRAGLVAARGARRAASRASPRTGTAPAASAR